MASGKQILLSLLTDYSQRQTAPDDLENVSQRVKAGLLLHGSTSNAMWKMVDQMSWVERLNDTEGQPSYLESQGLGLKESGLLLSDLFDLTIAKPDIPKDIEDAYPELTPDAYKAGVHMIGLLLRAMEWSIAMEAVEENGVLDEAEKDRLLSSYLNKLHEYALDPDDYS